MAADSSMRPYHSEHLRAGAMAEFRPRATMRRTVAGREPRWRCRRVIGDDRGQSARPRRQRQLKIC